MTHIKTEVERQESVETNRRTDKRTLPIALQCIFPANAVDKYNQDGLSASDSFY